MRENIRLCRYDVPTPIQAYAIPAVLTHHDLIAIAQTGKWKDTNLSIPRYDTERNRFWKDGCLPYPRPFSVDG